MQKYYYTSNGRLNNFQHKKFKHFISEEEFRSIEELCKYPYNWDSVILDNLLLGVDLILTSKPFKHYARAARFDARFNSHTNDLTGFKPKTLYDLGQILIKEINNKYRRRPYVIQPLIRTLVAFMAKHTYYTHNPTLKLKKKVYKQEIFMH